MMAGGRKSRSFFGGNASRGPDQCLAGSTVCYRCFAARAWPFIAAVAGQRKVKSQRRKSRLARCGRIEHPHPSADGPRRKNSPRRSALFFCVFNTFVRQPTDEMLLLLGQLFHGFSEVTGIVHAPARVGKQLGFPNHLRKMKGRALVPP
jgi:hypothetical protein